MSNWMFSGFVAVVMGGLAFAVFFVPIVFFHYRRYGTFTWLRILGAAGVSVYLAALLAYTLIPLPEPGRYQCVVGFQTTPLQFIDDIREGTAGMGLTEALTSFVVLQVVFNVVLFVPWGVIARRYLGWSIPVAVLTGLLISVSIELTQYTGLWFSYECAYRFADVDDIIINTAGALIGALIAPIILWFMPDRRILIDRRLEPRPVTVWRRWLGMIADLFLLHALTSVAAVGLAVAATIVTGDAGLGEWGGALSLLTWIGAGLIVFVLPALTGLGGSLGQRALWLAPIREEGGGRVRLVVRSLVSGGLYSLLQGISALEMRGEDGGLAGLVGGIVLAVAFLAVPFTRNQRGLSGVVSGTELVDVRTLIDREHPPERASFRREV